MFFTSLIFFDPSLRVVYSLQIPHFELLGLFPLLFTLIFHTTFFSDKARMQNYKKWKWKLKGLDMFVSIATRGEIV